MTPRSAPHAILTHGRGNHLSRAFSNPKEVPLYIGQHVAVRQIRNPSGQVTWALYRPYHEDRSAIDAFETEAFADRVAEIIDTQFAGSYAAPARKQAKRIARREQAPGEPA